MSIFLYCPGCLESRKRRERRWRRERRRKQRRSLFFAQTSVFGNVFSEWLWQIWTSAAVYSSQIASTTPYAKNDKSKPGTCTTITLQMQICLAKLLATVVLPKWLSKSSNLSSFSLLSWSIIVESYCSPGRASQQSPKEAGRHRGVPRPRHHRRGRGGGRGVRGQQDWLGPGFLGQRAHPPQPHDHHLDPGHGGQRARALWQGDLLHHLHRGPGDQLENFTIQFFQIHVFQCPMLLFVTMIGGVVSNNALF